MNAKIKEWIDARRRDVDRYYDLPPQEKRKAEALFAKMEQLGNECRSRKEFERKYLSQTMYREYNTLLLTEFSPYIKKEAL